MYNENDEMFEVSDYDEDINKRKALIEEAKALEEPVNFNDVVTLQRKWKRIPYWESAYEDTLAEEFDSYMDAFYAKRKAGYAANEEAKKELIEETKKWSLSEEWNKASEAMGTMLENWKKIGSAGKDSDDALWDEFNGLRQKFYDRKHLHWQDMQTQFKNAREAKEDLIERAKGLKDSKEWQKTSEAFRNLMEEWKEVGNAGRDCENALWETFNASRQEFYAARTKYYDALHAQQDEKYTAKQALVEKAKEILERKAFTREDTAAMKDLNAEWKKVGSCGKERENEIWNEFRGVMDEYFDGLKQFNEQRHQQWRQRLIDARTHKQELIQNQKRQIKHMEAEMVGLLGQRAIDDMQDRIAEKEDFIAELEEEVLDLEKTLAEDK